MLYYNANPRDGRVSNAAACSTCCCEQVRMIPGEVNLLTINYAGWSLPIGELIGEPAVSITTNADGCSTAAVDGFAPPANTNYTATTPVNTAVVIDLAVNSTPSGNGAAYSVHVEPLNGTVAIVGGNATYTPAAGFNGFDVFWFKTTDAAGRVVTRSSVITVGAAVGAAPHEWSALKPSVDRTKIIIDPQMHTARVPLRMSVACRSCETYEMRWTQKARDCAGNIYEHIMCFDIRCTSC